jgi:chorismate mutase
MEKKLLCIRGASGCENTENSMIKNVGELFDKIVKENNLNASDIVSIQFTVTPDLNVINPATALRKADTCIKTSAIPLFCSQEPVIKNMKPFLVRVLFTVYSDRDCAIPSYINGAEVLRPDLAGK